jgi:hypothetical protein
MSLSDHHVVPWDELGGYEVHEMSSVDRIMSSLVRLDNGEIYQCETNLEIEVSEGDACVIFRQVRNRFRILEQIEFFETTGLRIDPDRSRELVMKLKDELSRLERSSSPFTFFKLLIGDNVYDAELHEG